MIPSDRRPAARIASVFPVSARASGESPADRTRRILRGGILFREERLRRLIVIALPNNRDLRVAMLNVERTRGAYWISRSSSLFLQ